MEEEDEVAHPVLSKILGHSHSILETALTCPTGVRAIASLRVSKNNRTEEEKRRKEVLRWANQERWLLSESDHYTSVIERKKTILAAREEALQPASLAKPKLKRDVTAEEENLQQSIAELQDELFRIVDENMRKELLLQQMHYSAIALRCVFPHQQSVASSSSSNSEDTNMPEGERKQIELLLRQRDQKSLEFLGLHNQLQALMAEGEKVQEKNRVQRMRNQELWAELKRLQEEMEEGNKGDGEEKEKEKEGGRKNETTKTKEGAGGSQASNVALLERKLSMNVIIREVFQALILESGVNWARDEKLRTLMLSLDTSLPPPKQTKLPSS